MNTKEKSHDKECDICGKMFVSARHVTIHKKSDHGLIVKANEKCYICFKTFCSQSALWKHLNKFHVQCDKCDQKFDSENDLDLHFIATHINVKESEKLIKRTQKMIECKDEK